uniref:Trehalase n=1 Tax=Periophthalmus magnuspinnatus TaxID=409849 RepID=A0A3B4BIQ3_9GOBI
VWFTMSSWLILLCFTVFISCENVLPPPCDSEIYCTGSILDQVQKAKLYDDDKYFVDMKLKVAPDIILSAFKNLSSVSPTVPREKLQEFLNMYFEKPGTEFETWTPPDWHSNPAFLNKIKDTQLREWALNIHQLWKLLGKKIQDSVKDHAELYSQIYMPYPVVVPGGRFRELYYWDSYWVINGLLLSEMRDTAKGMIQNFLHLVDRYGCVPNGGRIYYERRSQPPFLTLMVENHYSQHKLFKNVQTLLDQEYSFWMQNRSVLVSVNGNNHSLNRFDVQVGLPRPESYTDDLELAEGLTEGKASKQQLWMDLKAGAESGWDFSSRWYISSTGQNSGTLKDIRTSQIVPSDLNALLCRTEKVLASFHRIMGSNESAVQYEQAAQNRLRAMDAVLWDDQQGAWFDYNLQTGSKHLQFYPSNLAPLWAECYSDEKAHKAVEYLKGSGALKYPNGVPTSLVESGQQWDYPNAWPPLQHMLIEGLSKVPSEDAKQLAEDLAQKWIRTNWKAYTTYEAMFEKYDVNGDGKPGGGGEYEVQLGFGWTNGVALQLLDQYGASLTSGSRHSSPGLLLIFLLLLSLLFTLH